MGLHMRHARLGRYLYLQACWLLSTSIRTAPGLFRANGTCSRMIRSLQPLAAFTSACVCQTLGCHTLTKARSRAWQKVTRTPQHCSFHRSRGCAESDQIRVGGDHGLMSPHRCFLIERELCIDPRAVSPCGLFKRGLQFVAARE